MADLSITAANVRPGDQPVVSRIAGETITAGQTLYKKLADGKMWKSDANDTADTAVVDGIAVTNASADEPVLVHTTGTYDVGATVTVGETYILSATAGGIAPVGDSASGWYTTILGVAVTTSEIELKLNVSGVAKA